MHPTAAPTIKLSCAASACTVCAAASDLCCLDFIESSGNCASCVTESGCNAVGYASATTSGSAATPSAAVVQQQVVTSSMSIDGVGIDDFGATMQQSLDSVVRGASNGRPVRLMLGWLRLSSFCWRCGS